MSRLYRSRLVSLVQVPHISLNHPPQTKYPLQAEWRLVCLQCPFAQNLTPGLSSSKSGRTLDGSVEDLGVSSSIIIEVKIIADSLTSSYPLWNPRSSPSLGRSEGERCQGFVEGISQRLAHWPQSTGIRSRRHSNYPADIGEVSNDHDCCFGGTGSQRVGVP